VTCNNVVAQRVSALYSSLISRSMRRVDIVDIVGSSLGTSKLAG
jgi:hypothetical protein